MKKYPEQLSHSRYLTDRSKRSVLSHTSRYSEDALQPRGHEGHKPKVRGASLLWSLAKTPRSPTYVFSCKAASHSGLRFKPGRSHLLTWSYDTVVICSWCVSGFACKCHWCRMLHGFGAYCWWYKPCQEESEQYGQRAGTIQQRDCWEPGQLPHPCVPLPALRGLGSIACGCQEACVQTMFKGFLNSVLSKGNAIVFNSWIKMSGFCL